MKRSVLVLVILLASISVGSAFALTIRFAGDVTVDGTLDVVGTITIPNPTIDNLQGQIINLGGIGLSTPINAATLDGLDSLNFAVSNQSCPSGQLVTGFDASGNEICKEIKRVRDLINGLGVSGSDGTDGGTSVTIGTDGNPVISFHNAVNGNLMFVHCTTPSCSLFDTPVTLDAASSTGQAPSIAIGSDGFPIISYRDENSFDLRLVHCKNISCFGGAGVGFDTPITLLNGDGFTIVVEAATSIAIGTDGFAVIASYHTGNAINPTVFLIHCTSVDCFTSAPDPLRTLDSNAVGFPSVAIGSDNNPIVSYLGTSDSLKVVHCTDQSCSSADSSTTIDPGTGFTNTSITIGSDTFPVISYGDNSNLKLVHCTNISCSSGGFDTPITIASFGLDELDKSIAIGLDGFPILAVRDNTIGNFIQIVDCEDVLCSSFIVQDTINDAGVGISLAIGNDGLPVIASLDGFVGVATVTRTAGVLFDGTVIP